jgi:hypothetical protein
MPATPGGAAYIMLLRPRIKKMGCRGAFAGLGKSPHGDAKPLPP